MADEAPASVPAPQVLDWRIFLVVTAILVLLTSLFLWGMKVQWEAYHAGIIAALAPCAKDHAASLSYDRALGAAIVKTSALFLGFLLVFTGALYVLRTASVAYRAGMTAGKFAGTLETHSPGLVIITLGVILISVTILTHSDINYVAPSPASECNATSALPQQESHGVDWEPVAPQPSVQTTTPPSERRK